MACVPQRPLSEPAYPKRVPQGGHEPVDHAIVAAAVRPRSVGHGKLLDAPACMPDEGWQKPVHPSEAGESPQNVPPDCPERTTRIPNPVSSDSVTAPVRDRALQSLPTIIRAPFTIANDRVATHRRRSGRPLSGVHPEGRTGRRHPS